MRLKYNSPVILTYSFICVAVLGIRYMMGEESGQKFMYTYFTAPSKAHFSLTSPLFYFRLVSHAIGHMNWSHLVGNFSFILLIGPMLEEKYGSTVLLEMMLMTAFITGGINSLFFSNGILGASGIVFMLILLSSFTNFKSGDIPLTLILIVIMYLAKEVLQSFNDDHISQYGHIMGGLSGAAFGFLITGKIDSFK